MGCQIISAESRQVQSMISLHLLTSELQASANGIINLQLLQGHKKLSPSLEFLFSFLPSPHTHTDTQHVHVHTCTHAHQCVGRLKRRLKHVGSNYISCKIFSEV